MNSLIITVEGLPPVDLLAKEIDAENYDKIIAALRQLQKDSLTDEYEVGTTDRYTIATEVLTVLYKFKEFKAICLK